ncbi:blue copper protein 1b-like [Juglans microcarpa x Juglans regia]|uniref:blue copper protein 1b-like n=1 Tax=Juglans microcarpa x Juglans regia TaxID=2249226 RepID=UPI001B7EADDE|nr:blue copper protein 1b-like [Juglans microcarpa x Juglans regia]
MRMKMAFTFGAQGFILLAIAASFLVVGEARTIVVGGSEGWRFGFNYTDWALKASPFYLNDKLVFKYAPPSDTSVAPNVYLLPNRLSYMACNFSSAKLLATETQVSGKGFEFVLNRWRPAYFASTAEDGSHCSEGQMKFFAIPWPHPN